MSTALEVADVFRRHGEAYRRTHDGHLSRVERRVMSAVELCRTAPLGGHVEACDDCGLIRCAYNSCRNRHCPKYQGAAREAWLAARQAELLPVAYFHVVFTLPAPVAEIAFQNKAAVYAILLRTAAETLRTIAADPKHLGAEIGLIAVLPCSGHSRRRAQPALTQPAPPPTSIAVRTAAGPWSPSASSPRHGPGLANQPSGATAHDAPPFQQNRAHPTDRQARRAGSCRAQHERQPQAPADRRPEPPGPRPRLGSGAVQTGRPCTSARPDIHAPRQDQRLGPTRADTLPIARPPPRGFAQSGFNEVAAQITAARSARDLTEASRFPDLRGAESIRSGFADSERVDGCEAL